MEVFIYWIKNIAFYMILITAVINALPDNHFKKYIKFFTGMLLIILLISPISQLLTIESNLDFSFIQKSYEIELEEIQNEIGNLEYIQSNQLFSGYSSTILDQIEDIVTKEGLYLIDGEVKLVEDKESNSYGTIEKIDLYVSRNDGNENSIRIDKIEITGEENPDTIETLNIKNAIIEFYQIPIESITINFSS